MQDHFIKRKDQQKHNEEGHAKSKATPRADTLTDKQRTQQNRTAFVNTRNPCDPPRQTWHNTHFQLTPANRRLKQAIKSNQTKLICIIHNHIKQQWDEFFDPSAAQI